VEEILASWWMGGVSVACASRLLAHLSIWTVTFNNKGHLQKDKGLLKPNKIQSFMKSDLESKMPEAS
jgi:hypothetical protein